MLSQAKCNKHFTDTVEHKDEGRAIKEKLKYNIYKQFILLLINQTLLK
jgi:hypothetical protein